MGLRGGETLMMSTGGNLTTMLKDVVAYVDVWSSAKTDNYSAPFIQQLEGMGAKVSKSFNKHVTHVVFKNGHQATWNKAKKTGVKLVSVLWVDRCNDGERIDEDVFPAFNDDVSAVPKKRTHRCMQPRDTPERTPENDRRMKKKLEQMMKALPPIIPLYMDESPFIINHEHGIVYSPTWKRSESMAQRLKEMREQRENLSPTDDELEDGPNTTVAAQHRYSPHKEDEEKRHSPDHCEPGLFQSSTPSNESLTAASASVDEDNEVFAPADLRQRKQMTRSLPSETKSLSEQVSSRGKRKQRHGETTEPESAHAKKRKREGRQSATDPAHESVNVNGIQSQQGIRESPLPVDSHNMNAIPTRSRRCTLPAMRAGELATEPVNLQRASSIPAASEQQKNSDGDVLPYPMENDELEDGPNTTVAAQHRYLPHKEDEEKQHSPDHCEPLSLHEKDSQKPWLSPCSDGPRLRSVINVKHLDIDDLEKGTTGKQIKKPRRSSVKKDPIIKRISLDCLESPCQEDRPEESKNRQSPLKPHIPAVGKSVKSPSKFKKGKHTNRTVQSPTKSTTYANLEFSNLPICPSPPVIFGKANVTQRLFKEPSLKVDPRKAKQTRLSIPGLLQSSTASNESLTLKYTDLDDLEKGTKQNKKPRRSSVKKDLIKKQISLDSFVEAKQTRLSARMSGLFQSSTASNESLTAASASVDEDDEVFAECASPADLRQRKQITRSLPSETKSLSEQVSSRGKRKQRHGETTEPESAHVKKRKREGRQSATDPSHESVNVNGIQSQQGIRESPSPVDSHINAIPTRSRRRTLPAMRAGELATEHVNLQRASSIPAASEQQKNSDGDVLPYPMESKGNELAAAAGLTDTTSEGKENKQANLVKKMDNYRKTMRTLVMTSMPTDNQSTVTQVVSSLGGFSIVDRVCESTTHVVSGGPRRTLNILLGIARGCWILSFEWILWCLEQRQWIPEEPYELSDHFPAAPICRLQQHLSAGDHQQDLFQGQPLMFVSPHCQPPTQSLVELIQLCGGTVCKAVGQAGVCIGAYSGKRPKGGRILSEQWVLDCITHLKQLSYDNYDLE